MTDYKGIEYIYCPICKQSDTEHLFTAPVQDFQKGIFSYDEWNIVKCKNCQLIYVNPRISTEVNDRYYRFEIDGDHTFLEQHFVDTAQTQNPYWQRLIRLIQNQKKHGKLLDIGSGNGSFLIQAHRAGFDTEGQDISPYFIDFCKKTYGLKIHDGELSSLNLPANSFDVITLFDVIEHHREPIELLLEIKRILKPDGVIALSTHDIGNIFARVYGRNWRMIYPIGHLYYFTRRTCSRVLDETGFQVIKIGGGNIIDINLLKEVWNFLRSSFTTIFLRGLALYIYKPLSMILPIVKRINVKYRNTELTHDLILFKAGNQLISNDEMVIIAKPK